MAASTQEEILKLLFQVSGDDDLAALAKSLADLGKSADGSGDKARKLLDELQKLGSTADGIQKFTRLKGEVAETGTKIAETSQRLQQLRREIDASAQPNDKLAKSFDRTQAELDKLMRLQNRQSAELTRTGASLRKAGVDTDQLGAAYERLQGRLGAVGREAQGLASGVNRVGDEQGKAAGSATRLKQATDEAGKSVAGLANRLTKISAATAAASAAMLAFGGARLFKGAIDSAIEFESTLSEVQAVSGASAEELIALKQAAEEGGRATKFSVVEAAQGLTELARSTGDAKTAIAALPATLNLAQAATLGVAEAAGFVTTTLTQFGLGADDAALVADVLAKAANSTESNVQGLGLSLSYAAPLARQLGLDLEETTAIIAAMADQGFKGERAGTALRNVFSALQDPTSEFAKALRGAGIDSTNFTEIIDQLAKGGPRAQQALLKLDAAARPAIASLVGVGSSKLRELEASLRNAGGEAERTAQRMGDNLGGALERLTGEFDQARRDLVEPLLAPLQDELRALAGELEAFAKSSEFEEIKSALKELFVQGAQAAREFASEVDFSELATSIRDFVNDSRGNLSQFQESIKEVVAVVKVLGDTIDVVVNAVQVAVFAMATALTGAVSLLASASAKLSGPQRAVLEFLGVSTEGYAAIEEFAGGMAAITDEFGKRTKANFDELTVATGEFGEGVTSAGDAAAAKLQEAGQAAAAAAAGGLALGEAGTAAAAGLNAQAAAADAAAGKTNAAAAEAEGAAARIQAAFADLGIKSRADLDQTASSMKRSFDLIAAAARDGQRPIEDVRAAFVAYGRAALEAVQSADESVRARVAGELAVQASVNGVTEALAELGLASQEVGRKVGDNVRQAVPALQQVASAAQGAAAATSSIAATAGDASEGLRDLGEAGSRAAVSFGGLTEASLRAYAATNRYVGTRHLFVNAVNAVTEAVLRQRQAVSALSEELDNQLKDFDPLAEELAELQRLYSYVDEATLREIAEKRQRLKQERQRIADERRQLRQEQGQSDAGASTGGQASASPVASSRSLESGRVFIVELRAGEESVQLPVTGDPGQFEDFMRHLQRHRAVATGGKG